MKEIELKFKINNFEEVYEKLKKEGCIFSEKLKQSDSIFVPDITDTSSNEGKKFIRIRKENEKVEMNIKIQSKKKMCSEEIEFEVSDYELANKFLIALGLERWVEVVKTRITTKYKEYNICIDQVERLGNFIEIEKLTTDDCDMESVENELIEIAKSLKIDTDNRINSHYDTMISELNN